MLQMAFFIFPPCSSHANTSIFFISCGLTVGIPTFIVILLFLFALKKCKDRTPRLDIATATQRRDTFSVWSFDGRIAFEDIIRATEDFDNKYCIGIEGYGCFYKARLQNGKVFALKKLHPMDIEEPIIIKSLEDEARILSTIRHRNIVKFYGFCFHKKYMFLICDYMKKGSLFCALRHNNRAIKLDWSKRVDIVKGVAHALSYLHHSCTPSIVHCNISSNNILLNSEFNAFIADFGMARFLHSNSSPIRSLQQDTELAYTMKLTEKYDVYSFGETALEVLTGTHQADHLLLSSTYDDNILLIDILDKRLMLPRHQMIVKDIVLISTIAFACLHSKPKSRPTMKRISQEFLARKPSILSSPFHQISVAELRKQGMYLVEETNSSQVVIAV